MFVSLAVFCTTERVRCLLRCPQSISLDVPGPNLDSLCLFFATTKKKQQNLNVWRPRNTIQREKRKKKSLSHSALRLCNRKRGPVLLILSSDKSGKRWLHSSSSSFFDREWAADGRLQTAKKKKLTDQMEKQYCYTDPLKEYAHASPLGIFFLFFSFFFCFILSATIWRQLRNV